MRNDFVPQGHVLVETVFSAVRPGAKFPALVGEVIASADDVDPQWFARKVFTIHPPVPHALLRPEALIPIPSGVPLERAGFYGTVETGLALVWAAAPLLGEKVLVMGTGSIGSLTAALFKQAGVDDVALVDPSLTRLKAARELGITQSFLGANLAREVLCSARGFDVVVETTGNPESLSKAITAAGLGGRIVLGPFYDETPDPRTLDETFHHHGLRLVSTHELPLSRGALERFDRARRTEVVWDILRRMDPTVLRGAECGMSLGEHCAVSTESAEPLPLPMAFPADASD